jgi:hypothetical protein
MRQYTRRRRSIELSACRGLHPWCFANRARAHNGHLMICPQWDRSPKQLRVLFALWLTRTMSLSTCWQRSARHLNDARNFEVTHRTSRRQLWPYGQQRPKQCANIFRSIPRMSISGSCGRPSRLTKCIWDCEVASLRKTACLLRQSTCPLPQMDGPPSLYGIGSRRSRT